MFQSDSTNSLFSVHVVNQLDVQEPLTNFWKLEEVPDISQPVDDFCEDFFVENTTRNEEGRYVVRLPRKEDVSNLGDSRSQALKRFYSLDKRLKSSPDLKENMLNLWKNTKS